MHDLKLRGFNQFHLRKINWFRLNRELHRDIGYFCIGLTIVFAVSGIALNHINDWNPNYIIDRQQQAIALEPSLTDAELNQALITQFDLDQPLQTSHWESPKVYKLFFEGGATLTASFAQQQAVFEQVKRRPVFKAFNELHLNQAKQGWIVFSDLYAGFLLFLALSALFMVKGKYSPFQARRGWLVLLGIAIPCFYIFI